MRLLNLNENFLKKKSHFSLSIEITTNLKIFRGISTKPQQTKKTNVYTTSFSSTINKKQQIIHHFNGLISF